MPSDVPAFYDACYHCQCAYARSIDHSSKRHPFPVKFYRKSVKGELVTRMTAAPNIKSTLSGSLLQNYLCDKHTRLTPIIG